MNAASTAATMGIFFGILIFYLAIFALAIASYVMTSLSFYTIAKRRQIAHPWLAWVPLAMNWTIGAIADDYDAQRGIQRKWRVVLLTLAIIAIVGVIAMYAVMFASIIATAMQYGGVAMEPDGAEMLGVFIPMFIMIFLLALSAGALGMCQAICIYKTFESTVPEKSLKYFLLYVLVPLAGAICLIKCKDQGYDKPELIPIKPEFNTAYSEPVSAKEPASDAAPAEEEKGEE